VSLLHSQSIEVELTNRLYQGEDECGVYERFSLFHFSSNVAKSRLFLQRTGCDFTKDVPDYQMCETGGCNGGLECDPDTGTWPFTEIVEREKLIRFSPQVLESYRSP